MTIGIQELERQLHELGFSTERLQSNMVAFRYEIPHGRFKGRTIQIALEAPQFPRIVPAGLYIRPHLLPFKTSGTQNYDDGIHNRRVPTPEWQYWSRRFKDWDTTEKSLKVYLSFIRSIFDFS